MTIKVPDTIDQAAADKLIRELATRANSDGDTIAALKEANQRLEEKLSETAHATRDADGLGRYIRQDGSALLQGIERTASGRETPLRYADEGSVEPSMIVHGLLDDPNPKSDLQRDLQRVVNHRNIARQIMGAVQSKNKDNGPVQTPLHDAEIRRLAGYLPEPLQRTFNGSSGTGSQWIPSDVYPELMRAMNQLYEYMLPGFFQEIQVARSGTLPLLTAGFLPYIQSAPGADPSKMLSSDAATNETTVTLKTLAAMTMVGMDASEEAIFNVMGEFNSQLALALLRAEEDAMINGQASTTSVDTGLATWNPDSVYPTAPGGDANDLRKLWNGFRHLAVDASKATDRSTFSFATWGADRAAVKGPKPPGSMLYIGSEAGLWKNFYTLDQVATMEKIGAQATVNSGGARQVGGSTIYESQFMTTDLNATGIYDGSTLDYTGALHVLTTAFRRISRYGVRVFSQVDETRGIIYLGGKTRRDFVQTYSSDTPVHYEYKLAKA